MRLFLAIRNSPAIPIHPHRIFPKWLNNTELFVSIKRTNIYISSYKFVLNRSISMEVWFDRFPLSWWCSKVSRCRHSYTCNTRTSTEMFKKTQFDSEYATLFNSATTWLCTSWLIFCLLSLFSLTSILSWIVQKHRYHISVYYRYIYWCYNTFFYIFSTGNHINPIYVLTCGFVYCNCIMVSGYSIPQLIHSFCL
jgi:hypothetical protein